MLCLRQDEMRTLVARRWIPFGIHDHLNSCYTCAFEFAKWFVMDPGPMYGHRTIYGERYLRTIGQDDCFPPFCLFVQ